MTERIIYAILALALAALAAVFAFGAHEDYVEHVRYSDFDAWIQSPGRLQSLRLRQVVDKSHRPYRVDCEYTFEFAGQVHAGSRFELRNRSYATVEEAKAMVHSALGEIDHSRWRPVRRDQLVDWTLDTAGIGLPVRHSARDPLGSSLTATPPSPAWINWFVIAVQLLGALLTGLASPVMVVAIFLNRPKLPSAEEIAMGDPTLPLVPFLLRDAYANRVDAALLAAQQLREAEGDSEALENVMRTLRAELQAARSDKMRLRRRRLDLHGRLNPKGDPPLRDTFSSEVAAVDAYVQAHLSRRDPDRS